MSETKQETLSEEVVAYGFQEMVARGNLGSRGKVTRLVSSPSFNSVEVKYSNRLQARILRYLEAGSRHQIRRGL